MLSFVQYLKEARSHKEANEKASPRYLTSEAELAKYHSEDSKNCYFASFTAIDKIGINPHNKFHTPTGIYFYPLDNSYWEDAFDHFSFPFTGNDSYKYIHVVKLNKVKGIKSLDYTWSDYEKDLEILKAKHQEYPFDDIRKETSAFKTLWYLTHKIALKKFKNDEEKCVHAWSMILFKELGYNFVADFGEKAIHPNEPAQMVVFNIRAFKEIAKIDRKERKLNPNDPSSFSDTIDKLTEKLNFDYGSKDNLRINTSIEGLYQIGVLDAHSSDTLRADDLIKVVYNEEDPDIDYYDPDKDEIPEFDLGSVPIPWSVLEEIGKTKDASHEAIKKFDFDETDLDELHSYWYTMASEYVLCKASGTMHKQYDELMYFLWKNFPDPTPLVSDGNTIRLSFSKELLNKLLKTFTTYSSAFETTNILELYLLYKDNPMGRVKLPDIFKVTGFDKERYEKAKKQFISDVKELLEWKKTHKED